ncbi:putative transcription initiation factor TFIIA small subunit [Blattamonas nauphoetae]|uniref:Transcription initiation factor TFIIA small subunit n=1 Tax=Blattamonas nauphoetae TaxID=2049346 RepID=A0ABQ9XTA6_9EUKA|nr:putative transcription initiation factor TFIIA small subunit [Blattamonas nauphoetae]
MSLQIYRNTTLGETLIGTLDSLISQGRLNEQQKELILQKFDESIETRMNEMTHLSCKIKGEIQTRNFVDDVYTINASKCTLYPDKGRPIEFDKIHLICCNSKLAEPTQHHPTAHEGRRRNQVQIEADLSEDESTPEMEVITKTKRRKSTRVFSPDPF